MGKNKICSASPREKTPSAERASIKHYAGRGSCLAASYRYYYRQNYGGVCDMFFAGGQPHSSF